MESTSLSKEIGYIGYVFTATTSLSFVAFPLFVVGLVLSLIAKKFDCRDFYINLSGLICSLFFIIYLLTSGLIALS
jgi:hypothetical protein